MEGMLIPGRWARAAIDACRRLGIAPTGEKFAALDVADEGADANAICGATGVEVDHLEEWSGKGADIFRTTERAFLACDEHGWLRLRFDADGLGAGVRGDARVINERRRAAKQPVIAVEGFRGSEAVFEPEREDVKGRKNKDFFANRKAQMWWHMRGRFHRTYLWVEHGVRCDPNEIVSISSACPLHQKLVTELSQPTYAVNGAGKIVIDKKPDGVKSPNLGDAAMIRLARGKVPMRISDATLAKVIRGW